MAAAGPVSATVRATFEHFDRDNSNTLEKRELSAALRHLGIEHTTGETIDFMNRFDTSGQVLAPMLTLMLMPMLMRMLTPMPTLTLSLMLMRVLMAGAP